MSFFENLFKENPAKTMGPAVDEINSLEPDFEKKSKEELAALTAEWKKKLAELVGGLRERPDENEEERSYDQKREAEKREKQAIEDFLQEILPQAFAAVREAAKRTLGQRHFDAQLMGGMTLNAGKISEMKTGEGKTLSSTLAVYLNALAGRGVHVVTVNDYLARRDASWMGQIYDHLGLSVGAIQHDQSFRYQSNKVSATQAEGKTEKETTGVQLDVKNLVPCGRAGAYACDITYGTNNEYGFDYLRDNMVQDLSQKVQRELYYAIVDEVDSILIDEARTPLIISAPDTAPTDQYYQFAQLVQKIAENEDYNVDLKKKSATLTEAGIAKIEKLLGVENIYVEKGVQTVHHIEQALRAKTLFKLDRDYVVREGEIVIVDEFTGRMLPGRRYSEGLHQAIEAKEGVEVQRESKTLATITFQNYFRLYKKLSGMTGTAMTEEEEFRKIYGLAPAEIPTNRPMVRLDRQDAVFKSEKGKYEALAREVRALWEKGQPVLIGTVSIEKNEQVSGILAKAGIPHQILNAKNHEQEARIIAQAGRKKAVTLATNIAGRGVDIILGGMPYDKDLADEVRALGGLHILGTERHESRRIDNQLRGRAGRQGDPGSSQFYVSLEDDLIRLFGGDRVQRMMNTLGIPDDMPIEHGMVSRVIEQAQKKIEGLNFDMRKHVLEFDDVMNKHREVIYRIRNRALSSDANLKNEILQKLDAEISSAVLAAFSAPEHDNKAIYDAVAVIFPFDRSDATAFDSPERYIEHFTKLAHAVYEEREKHLTSPLMRQIERIITLQAIDSIWMEHLDTMDHLRDSVRLRGYAQRDPLIEYKREGFGLFERLLAEIDKSIAYMIFRVEVEPRQPGQRLATNSSAPRPSGQTAQKVGRNDPCPCGAINPATGQVYKYKKCGMINAPYHKK